MPKIIKSQVIITILVEVTNDDGSKFSYSRTGTRSWLAAGISERRFALLAAVKEQSDRFLEEVPISVTND